MSTSAQDFGKILGDIANRVSTIEGNIYPDDPSGQFQINVTEAITATEHGTITIGLYPTDSFIIDHPVYGYIDSSVLKIDGGYLSTSTNQTF